MNPTPAPSVQRARKTQRSGSLPRGYKCTWEMLDESTQTVLAATDLVGAAVHSTIIFTTPSHEAWQMAPNRKLMPSSWTVTDPRGQFVVRFDQQILGKLTNPLHRVLLSLRNADGGELYRVIDPRTSVPDRVLGVGPDDWAIMRGHEPVAKLIRLPRRKPAARRGVLGRLSNWLAGSDRGIATTSNEPRLFPAPVGLALILLSEELTDTSGG